MADRHLRPGQIYRFDERTKFAVRLLARQTRKTMQGAIADAIQQAAARLDLGGFVWSDIYDDDEAIAALKLLTVPTLNRDDAERDRIKFIKAHKEFFYVDGKGTIPKRSYVIELWPAIEELELTWRRTRDEQPNAVRKMMIERLKKAGLQAPKAAA